MFLSCNFCLLLLSIFIAFHFTQVASACRDTVPSIKNARLVSNSPTINVTKSRKRRFKHGEVAVFVCNNGYLLEGLSPVMQCTTSGKWTRISGKGSNNVINMFYLIFYSCK